MALTFLGDEGDVDVGLELVEHRPPGELLAGDERRAGAGAVVALADHFHEEVDAAAEVGLVGEVEGAAAVAGAPAPVGVLVAEAQPVVVLGSVGDPGQPLEGGEPLVAAAGRQGGVPVTEEMSERVVDFRTSVEPGLRGLSPSHL